MECHGSSSLEDGSSACSSVAWPHHLPQALLLIPTWRREAHATSTDGAPPVSFSPSSSTFSLLAAWSSSLSDLAPRPTTPPICCSPSPLTIGLSPLVSLERNRLTPYLHKLVSKFVSWTWFEMIPPLSPEMLLIHQLQKMPKLFPLMYAFLKLYYNIKFPLLNAMVRDSS